ncbi:unnamed protein product, partial [Rotaria magnacalcarata]
PCVVPFISDHPRHVFSNIIQAALLRAVRYSSTLDIFEKERRAIRLMLLYNGYPSTYIDIHFGKFFGNAISQSSMIPFIDNENQFLIMRSRLLPRPSVKERETQHRIAAVRLNEETKVTNDKEKRTTITTMQKQNKANKFANTLFLHYTHEKRLHRMKREIHKIFSETFQGTLAMDLRLIVGHRNHRNTGHELVQKRPPPTMLKPIPLPNRLNMSLNFYEGPFPSVDQVYHNERIIPSPLTITDKTCEYILSDVVRQSKMLLGFGIPIITILLCLMLIIRSICSKYYWKKDEQQTENLQQDSKDLKQVIIHQDEPEDLSVVINPKMKLLATI